MDVKGIMHSPNCDIVLVSEVASIQFDTYYRKATNYVIMVTFVSLKDLHFRTSFSPSMYDVLDSIRYLVYRYYC